METIAKPTPEALRKAQAALNALNLAYEYFAPLAPADHGTSAPRAEYFEYVAAA